MRQNVVAQPRTPKKRRSDETKSVQKLVTDTPVVESKPIMEKPVGDSVEATPIDVNPPKEVRDPVCDDEMMRFVRSVSDVILPGEDLREAVLWLVRDKRNKLGIEHWDLNAQMPKHIRAIYERAGIVKSRPILTEDQKKRCVFRANLYRNIHGELDLTEAEVAELLKDPDAYIRNDVRKRDGGKLKSVMRPGDDLDAAIEWLVAEKKRDFEIDSGGPAAPSENAVKLLVRAGLYDDDWPEDDPSYTEMLMSLRAQLN